MVRFNVSRLTASGCVAKPNPHFLLLIRGGAPMDMKHTAECTKIDLFRRAAGGGLGPVLPTPLYTAGRRTL